MIPLPISVCVKSVLVPLLWDSLPNAAWSFSWAETAVSKEDVSWKMKSVATRAKSRIWGVNFPELGLSPGEVEADGELEGAVESDEAAGGATPEGAAKMMPLEVRAAPVGPDVSVEVTVFATED